jgi:TolA-binding protein
MKRVIAGLLLASTLAGRVVAQDAVALAAQREAEENVKRLSATITEVQAAMEQQRKEIEDLRTEVRTLRSDLAKANNNAVTHDALKSMSEQIRKVDENRIADTKKVYEALKELGKVVTERPAPPTPPPALDNPSRSGGSNNTSKPPLDLKAGPEEGFEYVVQKGDELGLIVSAYRKQNIMVTRKMVMDANPSIKWDRLRVGQKIFIPKPK